MYLQIQFFFSSSSRTRRFFCGKQNISATNYSSSASLEEALEYFHSQKPLINHNLAQQVCKSMVTQHENKQGNYCNPEECERDL